jgi:xylosylprotein 4-beta-galactosyltransferase
MHKLGIIVPYRDRVNQLLIFKRAISDYLSDKNINYELIIVEQDGAKIFNRGKLLNIGFLYAKKLKCDYVVFHDIDMMPINVDYSYSPYPVQLSTKFFQMTQLLIELYLMNILVELHYFHPIYLKL